MVFAVERRIKSKKHGTFNASAYFLQAVRQSVSPLSGSVLIINHRLSAELLLLIAERNHTIIQMTKAFDCGEYHARNGTTFDRNSTIIVFRSMTFEQEISQAKQLCAHYGADAVLVVSSEDQKLYEVFPKSEVNENERYSHQPE